MGVLAVGYAERKPDIRTFLQQAMAHYPRLAELSFTVQ